MTLRICILIFCSLLCLAGKGSGAGVPQLGEQLRRLSPDVVAPGPSLALGSTSGGSLYRAMRLPFDSNSLRVLKVSRRRGLAYGHSRLIQALDRVSQEFAREHQQALWIGNMAGQEGGRIRFSRSHQTGLDVDLVIPVLPDDAGVPSPAIRSVRSPDEPEDERPVMDVAATWTLVEALLMDSEVDFLWIFLSDPLIDSLIHYAVETGAPEKIVNIASHILHQPSDSLPHDDHLHIRVACHANDLLAGCRDSRPLWPWSRKTHEAVDRLVLGDLQDALVGKRDLEASLRAVLKTKTLDALPYAFVLMGDKDRRIASLAARVVDSLHRAQLVLAAYGGVLDKAHLSVVERHALERCVGSLCSQRVAAHLSKSRGCKRGASAEHRLWLKAMIREPEENAAESLKMCVFRLKGELRDLALDALARVAGQPVPDVGAKLAAKKLLESTRSKPNRRFERLWSAYVPPGAWALAGLGKLKKGVRGDGIDSMNRRELLEWIWAFPRKSNLMPRRRRARLWKNRLSALDKLELEGSTHREGEP